MKLKGFCLMINPNGAELACQSMHNRTPWPPDMNPLPVQIGPAKVGSAVVNRLLLHKWPGLSQSISRIFSN